MIIYVFVFKVWVQRENENLFAFYYFIAFYSTTVLQKACSYAVQYYFLVCVFFTLSHLPNFIFRIYNTHNAKGRRQEEKTAIIMIIKIWTIPLKLKIKEDRTP